MPLSGRTVCKRASAWCSAASRTGLDQHPPPRRRSLSHLVRAWRVLLPAAFQPGRTGIAAVTATTTPHCPCARVCSSVAHARDAKTSDQAQQVGTHPLLAQMQLKPIPTALAHALAKDLLRSRHTRAHAHVTPTHRVLTIKGRVPHRQPCACASLRVSARTRARARVKRGMRARPHGPVGNPKPPSSQCRVGRFVGGVRSKTVKRQM